ncbi:MAG: S9 family peptidase [Nitrospirae bacterium]|nr:MAG: S9 family peptidase [Nitrospirota bacterium]
MYRVALASGRTDELTPAPGTRAARPAPDHRFLLVTSSTIATPPRMDLVTAGGRKVRAFHEPDTAELDAARLPEPRFLEVPAEDGTPLHAMLILPPDGRDRPHPAVVYVYGGPHAQVVRNRWGRSTLLFHRWLAAQGFVVFALDNRGSAARGREFEGAVDHRLGQRELADQLAGVRWLKSQPFVDPERVGIWGWSYGGYMTCYALTHAPGVFRAGAAVAPVTDWRLYDSIYTERYMGTPEENPGGYAAGSVLEKVGELRDALLVIHGTGDDNVHLQNTIQLADRAWRAGKTFDLMLMPNLKHGLYAEGSHLQVFRRIARHFLRHLAGRDEVPE